MGTTVIMRYMEYTLKYVLFVLKRQRMTGLIYALCPYRDFIMGSAFNM